MTPTDPQADRLRDALQHRVETMHDAPISLEAVQGRAGRIRRNRRIGAGVGVAAVLAVVAPLGLVAAGQLSADEPPVQPAEQLTEAPRPAGEDRAFTLAGLERGSDTDVPWIDVPGDRVVVGGEAVDVPVPMVQDAVRYDAGLLVGGIDGGTAQLWFVPDGSDPVGPVEAPDARTLVSAPSRGELAYVESTGGRGQQLALEGTADPLGGGDERVLWELPEVGGFTPVGIGPDGVVLNAAYPDGSTAVLLADRGGELRDVPLLAEAVGVDAASGDVAGTLAGGERCAAVVSPAAERVVLEDCAHTFRALSEDGAWVVATARDADGFGDPSMLVLDAATGELQAGWSSRANPPVNWLQGYAWEDADTLVANVAEGSQQALVRFHLDGSAELASDPVETDPFGDLAVVLPD